MLSAVDPAVLSDHGALKYSGDSDVCCCQLNMDFIVSAAHSTISYLAEPCAYNVSPCPKAHSVGFPRQAKDFVQKNPLESKA